LPADHWSPAFKTARFRAVDIKQQLPNDLQLLIGLAAKYAALGGRANAKQSSPM